jgi:hypothetical protein
MELLILSLLLIAFGVVLATPITISASRPAIVGPMCVCEAEGEIVLGSGLRARLNPQLFSPLRSLIQTPTCRLWRRVFVFIRLESLLKH